MTGKATLTGPARELKWDTEDPASVTEAESAVNASIAEGRVAFDKEGTRLERFDPAVDEITVVSPIQGG